MKKSIIVILLSLLVAGCVTTPAPNSTPTPKAEKKAENTSNELSSLKEKGNSALDKKQYQEAMPLYEKGLALAQKRGNKKFESKFLNNIGIVYNRLGKHKKAIDYCEQALAISKKIKNREDEMKNLANLGDAYQSLKQYEKGIGYFEQALAIAKEIQDRENEIGFLGELGDAYIDLAQYEKAIGYYAQALSIAKELKNRDYEIRLLLKLGVKYYVLGENEKAIEYYEQALPIVREIKNRRLETDLLSMIGGAYERLNKYEKAIDYNEQSLSIAKENQYRFKEGRQLGNIGNIYGTLGQYEKAISYLEQAIAIAKEIKNRNSEGDFLGKIGIVYGKLGQYEKAIEYHKQALTVAKETKNRNQERSQLGFIGFSYQNLGQYEKAISSLEQALIISRETKLRNGELIVLEKLGDSYAKLNKYDKTIESYEQALAIAKEIKDLKAEGSSLGNLGNAYSYLGQYERSKGYYEQALAIAKEIKDRREEGSWLGNLGNTYHSLGQYDKAIRYCEQALAIAKEIKDRKAEGAWLGNLANDYCALGQYDKAIRYYEQALAIAKEIKDREAEGKWLGNLGSAYKNLRQYEKAKEYYEQAIAIAKETKDRKAEGVWLGNLVSLGHSYNILWQSNKARMYHKSIDIAKETKNRASEAIWLGNLGHEYNQLGEHEKAVDCFNQSIEIYKALGMLDGSWHSETGLGRALSKLNRPKEAVVCYEEALKAIETLREMITEKETKISFMQNKLFVYDEFIELLQSLHTQEPTKGYDKKSWEIFERKQGRVFLEEMGQSGARNFAGISENITVHENDLANQSATLKQDLQNENAKPQEQKNIEKVRTLESKIQENIAKQTALEEQIKQQFPDYYALKYPKPVELSELQQTVLKPDEMILSYGVMKDKTAVWLAGKNHFSVHSIPIGKDALEKQVSAFRNDLIGMSGNQLKGLVVVGKDKKPIDDKKASLINRSPFSETITPFADRHQKKPVNYFWEEEQKKKAQKNYVKNKDFVEEIDLYALLFPESVQKAIANVKADAAKTSKSSDGNSSTSTTPKKLLTLYIVPTESLYSLPFEALNITSSKSANENTNPKTGETAQHYLIEDYPIAYLSSASLLKIIRDSQARKKKTPENQLIAFANPVYTSTQIDENNIEGLKIKGYRDAAGGTFASLPETADEVKEIQKAVDSDGKKSLLQLQQDASRSSVFKLNSANNESGANSASNSKSLNNYRYVVFSCHGILPGEVSRLMQPALVLSDPDPKTKENGYLTMADVFGLSFNADLISLSACNTAQGQKLGGEGVMGLTRAFMYAGTPAIAVTLWSVESMSIKELNTAFFRKVNSGMGKAEALREVKIEMLKGKSQRNWSNPFYWSPLVVFGDAK